MARDSSQEQEREGREVELTRRVADLEAELSVLKERLREAREEFSVQLLVELLEADRVREARQLVELLLKAAPSPKLEQWARVLAPPTVHTQTRATGTTVSFMRTQEWLRQHAHEYTGKWVALRNGVLLGADESRGALHRLLEQSGELEDALFARL